MQTKAPDKIFCFQKILSVRKNNGAFLQFYANKIVFSAVCSDVPSWSSEEERRPLY